MHNTHTNKYYVVENKHFKEQIRSKHGNQLSDQPYPEYDTKPQRDSSCLQQEHSISPGTRPFQSTRITTCSAEEQSFSMSLKAVGWEEVSFQRREIPERFGGSSENAGLCTSKMMDWRGRQVNQGVNCMCGNILVVFLVSIIQSVSHKHFVIRHLFAARD